MAGHTEQSIVINAPMDVVWDATNDLSRWTELFSEYQTCEVLERDGNTFRFRLAMFPDENGIVWSWVSERTLDPVKREVHARRVETGPFEYMKIHWTYTQLPEGVRMTWVQDFAMKPTAPVNDQQMTDRINTNSQIQMKLIKSKVEGRTVVVAAATQPADTRRGGELRVLLGPKTVGSTAGFMGVATLQPGEKIAEHYHPYSEEFLYVARGAITVDLDDEPTVVPAGSGLFIGTNVRHRLRNTGAETAEVVFQLGPLAPRPELGHVDTEKADEPELVS